MSKAADLANLIGNIDISSGTNSFKTLANMNSGGGQSGNNLVINGGMKISQRNNSGYTSASNLGNGSYALDRFQFHHSMNGAITVTKDNASPDGFGDSMKVDVTTADTDLGTSQQLKIEHKIEGLNLQHLEYGASTAKPLTLSFYVKSNKTGTYAVNLQQPDNSNKMANLNYTINSSDTWERKSLTFTGDTGGVINDDNGAGLTITFALALGSGLTSGDTSATYRTFADANSGAGHNVNLLDNTSNEWFLTGVQLELGEQATAFENEQFIETLYKCRRYCQKTTESNGANVLNNSWNANNGLATFNKHNNYYDFLHIFPVEMRASPSLSGFSQGGAGKLRIEVPGVQNNEITEDLQASTQGTTGLHIRFAIPNQSQSSYHTGSGNAFGKFGYIVEAEL